MTTALSGEGGVPPMAASFVAASGQWRGPDGVRLPAGEVHACLPGQNQTLCGLALSRTGLRRFPHVRWEYTENDRLTTADRVGHICPGCLAATTPRRLRGRSWTRTSPRP